MFEYIKRKDALHILELVVSDENITHKYKAIRKRLKGLPSADVVEVRHGYWIRHIDDIFPADSTLECSVCHEEECIFLCGDNYCPNCGAKMDKKEGAEG